MKKLLDYFHPLEANRRKRKLHMENLQIPADLLKVIEQPYPAITDLVKDLEYIVLDIETTGFDSRKDRILSIGWVNISNGHIDLATAEHWYLKQDRHVKAETAVINHITPQMLFEGLTINEAITKFFKASKGKIIVAHACVMEKNFINEYLLEFLGVENLPLVWLDTLRIEKKLENAVSQQDDVDLTLAGTRARYGLPEYNGHNALADAIATAELLLVQQKRISPTSMATLGQLYKMSA